MAWWRRVFSDHRASWRAFASAFLGTAPVVLAVNNLVGGVGGISGVSMQPTLNPGAARWMDDRVLLDRWSVVVNHRYNRGDVVILKTPEGTTQGGYSNVVKRIVALEGDFVRAKRGKDKGRVMRIPPGNCWVEGDNAQHSRDSNEFGPVPLALIGARCMWVLLPPSRWGPIPADPTINHPPLAY